MPTYSYPTTATSNDLVNPISLASQIEVAGLTGLSVSLRGVTATSPGVYTDGYIDIASETALSSPEQATLAATVAAHAGVATFTPLCFRTMVQIIADEVALGSGWTDLGGVVLTPEFFVPTLANAVGQIQGDCKVQGTGAQLRLVEGSGGGERVITPNFALTNNSDVWTTFGAFSTNDEPSPGQQLYRLQGRLNGATSALVRFVTLMLLEQDS